MRWMNIAMAGALLTSGAMGAMDSWTIKVGGTSRNALVYVPSGISKPAMILQLHGMNQDAAYQQSMAKWEPIADTGKFVVVLPNGQNKQWDISGTKDVDFMSAIIDTMVKKHGVDRNRVYISGFSMGGMFTYHAMNKMSDKIAAFAPCSGYPMGGTTASATRPVPILHIHGDADDVVGYSGVAGALSVWRTFDGCPSTAVTTKPYPANKPGSVTTKTSWGPCVKNGATTEIVLLTNAGKGHWYSMDQSSELSSVEIWNFCKRYSLAGSVGVEGAPVREATRLSAVAARGSLVLEGIGSARSVRVTDTRGRVVAAGAPARMPGGALALPFERPSAGLYQVDVEGEAGRASTTVVVP